jgi:orotate phosphoribosyltransferase
MININLVRDLIERGMIKRGEFILKSGQKSNIYIDIRESIAYPYIIQRICDLYYTSIQKLNYDFICGVPYSALVFASAIAHSHSIPMILQRKEAKDYGMKKILEGVYNPGSSCVVLEDVITTGGSALNTVKLLRSHGLVVQHVCVLVDRSNNIAHELFSQHDCVLHSAITLDDIEVVLNGCAEI